MALDTDLGSLNELAESLGILVGGEFNPSWFEDPLGNSGENGGSVKAGLTTALYDDRQRDALIAFADEALGDPDRRVDNGEVWLPLVSKTGLTVFAVIDEPDGQPLHLGLGVEYGHSSGSIEFAVTAHIRAFQVDRQGHPLSETAEIPWLLLGKPGGTIDLEVRLTNTASPTPNEFFLGGATIGGSIPTSTEDDLAISVSLDDLQLPGASTPTDHHLDLDNIDTALEEILGFITGLVKAQADSLDPSGPVTGPFAAAASLIGLRTTPGITELPLAELPGGGIDALVDWIESTLLTDTSRNAWLAELARLLGGTADPARGAVSFTSGVFTGRFGLRTATGANGSPTITPWVEIGLEARDGADVQVRADLLTVDTTDGSVHPFPTIVCGALFGALANNGSDLLSDGFGLGSAEVGLRVQAGRPAFSLLLHDVETPTGQTHDLLDLSSPEAVRDAAGDVVDSELAALLDGLGPAGAVVKTALGLDPPAGVTGTTAVGLLTDPLNTVGSYWQRLVATPAALADVIEAVVELVLSSSATITGAGTLGDPWSIPVGAAGVNTSAVLLIWIDGDAIAVDLVLSHRTTVLDSGRTDLTGRLGLARIDVATPTVDLATGFTVRLAIASADGGPVIIDLDPAAIELDALGVEIGWRARQGLRFQVDAPGLAVNLRPLGGGRYEVPLPRIESDGSISWNPDWADIEDLLVSLLNRADDPAIATLLDVVGWTGDGAYLPLSDLIDDAASAVGRWLADLVLDCDNVATVLTPMAELLSGFRIHKPVGYGSRRRPFRTPIAGEPAAPGLAAWFEPPCPLGRGEGRHRPGVLDPSPDNRGDEIVTAVAEAGTALAELDDLLVGRESLADGLDQLIGRFAGTDGVIGRPAVLPDGVTGHDADGFSYRQMVALGSIDRLGPMVLGNQPANRLYVGIEEIWGTAYPVSFDRSTAEAVETPAALAATGAGPWSARIPSISQAQQQRPSHDGVTEQANRIAELVADRSQPVTVIAFGQAAAAAITAAASNPLVERVVTVGSPWSTVSTDAFTLGLSGDAVRFLNRFTDAPQALTEQAMALEASEVVVFEHVLERLVGDGAGSAPLDTEITSLADTSTIARPSGLAIDAVFGRLFEDDLWTAIGALLADGMADRFDQFNAEAIDEADEDDLEAETDDDDGSEVDVEVLHIGVDLPAFDLSFGGLLIGAGARIDCFAFDRDPSDAELRVNDDRDLVLNLRFGLSDGWLVGGPSRNNSDIEVRWLETEITLPLDSRPSSTILILHEARCFDVYRERWEVDAEQLSAATEVTTSLPEVHLILAEVVKRFRDAVGSTAPTGNDLMQLLDHLGVVRDGGYDPSGFERFLFDPAQTVDRLLSDPAEAATVLRGLSTFGPSGTQLTGSGSELMWSTTVGSSQVAATVDLNDRSVEVSFTESASGYVPLTAAVAVGPDGLALEIGAGVITPSAGGARVAAEVHRGSTNSTGLVVEWAAAGSAAPQRIDLLSGDGLDQLPRLLAALVPATLAQVGLEQLRRQMTVEAETALRSVLDGLGLLNTKVVADDFDDLDPTDVWAPIRIPLGLFLDPVAWLTHAADQWQVDPLGQAVAVLDAIRPLVPGAPPAPGSRGDERSWPITDGVSVRYQLDGSRLSLGLAVDIDHQLGSESVATVLRGGLAINANASSPGDVQLTVQPSIATTFTVGDQGLGLAVDPSVSLFVVRQPPSSPLVLYPSQGDVGAIVGSAAAMLMPRLLNALIAERTNASPSLEKSVGQVVFDLGNALDLVESGQFTEGRLVTFANDPVSALTNNVSAIGQVAVNSLVDALNDGGPSLVRRDGERLVIGPSGAGTGHLAIRFVDGVRPAVEIDARATVDDVGVFSLELLRLSADGLVATVSYSGAFDVGQGLILRPVLAVSAGVDGSGFSRSAMAGLALDGASTRTVGFQWGLDGTSPQLVGTAPPGDTADPALGLALMAASMATSIAIEMAAPLIGDNARPALEGVLLEATGAPGTLTVDAQFFVDLFEPDALLQRLFRLLANLGQLGLSVEIGSDPAIELGYFADTVGGFNEYGLTLSLPAGERFPLSEGDPVIELDIDDTWITAGGPAGLTLVGLRQSVADPSQFSFGPRVIARGIGIRIGQQSGPLLDLGGLGIDAIALHLYGESNEAGAGVGARLQLDGLAFAPTGQGDNAVASGITDEASAAGGVDARPAFSPSLAVQRPAGADQDVGVTLQAGEPPGPWWLTVQRELGPLYLERFGFNSEEQDGQVVGISLLFDGRVSLFGLMAQVDQLGIHWTGGSISEGGNWRVDIQGFAVSADLSGVFIAGGLLKTELEGNVGYLGMLTGRFGVYGLSLFGGYTQLGDTPSFFVFGAVNGPIGGPPAFFLTGIGGGLGINRGLRVPADIAKMNEYPFIQALDSGAQSNKPVLDQIRELDNYFPVEVGNIWFAAGISFTSFSLVDGIAVVSVSFGSGLDINLMGLARMALPRPEAALVSIELGLLARFSTEEGLFLIQAQLTDNSWLLYPEVRLTGGFAFATWWKGENAGQFVLTLGGYHPSFSRPGYPEVPRLGLVWQISDAIVVKGGSYFALTSEALMAGLDVEVSADFGFVWAKIAFGAHGIVYFDPFWFEVMAYASISAGIKIKTFFGTIRISISLGASIRVEGPDVSGVATIEVGPAEFDVPFGSRRKDKRPAITWTEFVAKYLEEAGIGVASVISSVAGAGALPAATGDGSDAPSPDGSTSNPFQVFAEFELTVVTTVPFTELIIDDNNANPTDPTAVNITARRSDGSTTTMGLSPMQASSLSPSLKLSLHYEVADNVYHLRRPELKAVLDGIVADATDGSEVSGPTFGVDGFPLGVWGSPNDADADVKPLPSPEVVFAGNRVKMVSAASLLGLTGPPIPYDSVEHGRRALPLSAVGAVRSDMLALAAGFAGISIENAEQAVATARHVLYAEVGTAEAGTTTPTDGPSDGVGRSRLGRAAYRGSRNAPPMFGTLTEGLDLSNPDGADSELIGPTPPLVGRQPRPPMVLGRLGPGSGRAPGRRPTTVSRKRIKRRPAPSTASVRGRLGESLALDLRVLNTVAQATDATLINRGTIPHTAAVSPWAVRERAQLDDLAGRLIGSANNDNAASGGNNHADRSDAEAGGAPVSLTAGEAIVLGLPDSDIDVDQANRPTLLTSSAVRIVAVSADGSVLSDQPSTDDSGYEVPVGTAALVATNTSSADAGYVTGWHQASRLLWAGRRHALGVGCVVGFDGQDAARTIGWHRANRLAAAAETVTTWFRSRPKTLAVVVAEFDSTTDGKRNLLSELSGIGIELHGMRVTSTNAPTQDGGGEVVRPPVMVQTGSASVVVVEVEPDPNDPNGRPRVRTDVGDRRVTGILGSTLEPDDLANHIATNGLSATLDELATRLDTETSKPAELRWKQALVHDREDN